MTVAVNTIGGKLLLLRPAGPVGHWLDVRLSRFVPGAVVRAGGTTREVQAGSSYLSSEDPRVHLGLGVRTTVPGSIVSFPWGGQVVLRNVRADRIVDVRVPERPAPRPRAGSDVHDAEDLRRPATGTTSRAPLSSEARRRTWCRRATST